LAQSFCPALAIPKHFSLSCAAAGAETKPKEIRVAAVAAIIARWFMVNTPLKIKFKHKARVAKSLTHWLAFSPPLRNFLTVTRNTFFRNCNFP
jgi:hypothetical protein